MFPQPSRTMRYFWTNCHRESHCLQHPGEQNHIGNPPRPPISTSLVYGMLLPCCLPTWTFKYDTAAVTPHSVQLTLAHFLSLDVSPSPVALHLYADSIHSPPDVSGSAHQRLSLLQVSVQFYLSEHLHYHPQGVLHPDLVLPFYPPVICVEDQLVLSCRPTNPVPRLLWPADYLQRRSHRHVHHDNKYHGGRDLMILLRGSKNVDE